MWKAAFTGRSESGGGSSAGRPSEPKRKKSHREDSISSSRPRDDDERDRERRRSSRGGGSVYESGEASSVYGVPRSGMNVGYGSSPSQMAQTAPLTASALRMLPDDEEEWEDEDKDARSERKSRRSEGERKRKSSGKEKEKERVKGWERRRSRSRSPSGEKERRKAASSSKSLREKEREREKELDKNKDRERERERERARDSQSERERDSKRRPQLVESPESSSRALPEMGSFAQFPGQYTGGHMGPLSQHPQDAIMSGALPNSAPQQGQFPGQDPYHNDRPPLEHSNHSYGAAADYYKDTGESVHHQPGVRPNSPNMLTNPQQHLVAASAVPTPAMDTGNGAANDFYSGEMGPVHGAGVSASAPVTPASKPKPKPAKQSSWSAFKPSKTSKPGKVSKPSKTSSSSSNSAAAMAAAAGVGVLGGASYAYSSSSQQQQPQASSSSTTYHQSSSGIPLSKPNRPPSDGSVYYGPPPQSQGQSQPPGGYGVPPSPSYTYGVPGSATAHGGSSSVNAYGAQSTNGGHGATDYANNNGTEYTTPGKHSSNSNSNIPLYAAGAAAAGLAAYGINQHHQHNSHNMSGSYSGGGGQGLPPPRPAFSHYPSSGGGGSTNMHQLHHPHEHKGPLTRLKDGLFNIISSPEDTAKMEMYTEYIGVCKYCFDPRTSPGDAPRQHHYHKGNRRDSFEELRRRRSNERLGRKGSNDSLRRAGSVRVDKENRYYASDSSRKRRESGKTPGILGAGLAAAGVATAANTMFNNGRQDFDDAYSVKSGHREQSSQRRRSRSSSREQRRRSTYGVVRPGDREEFVTVRRKDGTVERRRVRKQSRSSSRDGRSSAYLGAAAGAALGAGAASVAMRRRSRSHSGDSTGRRSERRSARSSYGHEEEPESGGIFGGFFSPPKKRRNSRKEHHKKPKGFFTFSNSSSSSSNSELAFGDAFSSKTSLPLRRKSSGRSSVRRSRRTSDDQFAATVAGIGATAAALAAAQKGGRINKRSSRAELGARKDVNRRGRKHTHGSPGSSDDEWEDELPSDVDDDSSFDGGLAFGDYGDRRVSSRQSLESINSQSSAGGLGAWGWRWGGKDKKRRSRNSTSPRPSYQPSVVDSFHAPVGAASGYAADASRPYQPGKAVHLDDTGRRLPSITSASSPSQPLQFVDPQPISDAGSRHHSIPGAFDPESPPTYRPGPAPLQQPQPTTPIKPAFTQNPSALEDPSWSRSSPRTSNSNNFVQDAAIIGAGALATAGIIAATSSNNSSGKKSRDSTGSNVRFGLTEDQQRKEDREQRRREDKQADEERRRADRTRALKEEAERATRESESRKAAEAEAQAREFRQEEIRRAREDENRRAAEAKLAAARREAEEQAELDRERQRSLREREDAYRHEQIRLAEEARQQEERREAEERERFQRQLREGEERRAKEAERKSSKSGRSRGQSVSERNAEKKQASSAWGPIAGATAAATVGAVIAGRESKNRDERSDSESRRSRKTREEPQSQEHHHYQAKEVTPNTSHAGEPVMDDDIFDPDYFKRKPQYTPSERARHEELARKAAEKVISDREHAYDDHSTYAEFFAPKDILSEPAEGKTKVLGPNADNDILVFQARDAPQVSRRHSRDGVPRLALISPTPPVSEASPVRSKASPSSPLATAAQTVEEVVSPPEAETDSDTRSERLNRSVSWGEDKTHVYIVRTPESYNEKERDSYITSQDVPTASGASVVVEEEVVPGGMPKTTVYEEDELARHYRDSAQRFGAQYRQPFAESVSDFSFQLPSPGTEGAPPVRGFVEGETDEPTPVEEKTPHIPGGFDDEVDDSYPSRKSSSSTARKEEEAGSAGASKESEPASEPAWEPPLSKKDKKKREKAAKEAEPEPVVEAPAAWEPPLSKKEQKKRDKAAKRSSTIDSEPSTPVVAEPEAITNRDVLTESPTPIESVEEPAWEPPLSKKEQKKRDKAKKQGFADVVSSLDSLPPQAKEPDFAEDRSREASLGASEEPALTKKEQRKQEKQAKKSGFGGFADVADTILAAGGIAAAAAALDSTEDDGFSSAGKKKGKKGKKPKLGEPVDRDIRDAEPYLPLTEPSTMPGGWEADQESPGGKDEKPNDQAAFDPFQYQVHEDDPPAPPAVSEPPAAHEADPWSEFSEPKKSKKKSKRNSSAFNFPEVSSPLRTEVAWDDYVTGDKPSADSREVNEEAAYTNGNGTAKNGESTRSERTPSEPAPVASERRASDYFGDTRQEVAESSRRTSPDDSRSVASAPTPSRRDESRRGSDYFDEPSYAYETQSVAASEPADLHGSSKKSKRRSRHEDDEPRRSRRDDDDDTRSVTSSRSRREKEESPSVKKDKKSGILGSLFGRKSESSRDPPRDSKSSKDEEDEEARRRRKKKHRESMEIGDDDDDTRSVKSESRHRRHRSRSEYGDDDDSRSVKSESRHRSHRSEAGTTEDSRERRRRSTHGEENDHEGSESGKRHHRRRKSGDDGESLSRRESRSESGHHHRRKTDEDSKDQSFLGMRVEDLPPLPVEIPATTSSSVEIGKSEQGVGTPVQTGLDAGMVNIPDDNDALRAKMLSPETPRSSAEGFSPRPGSSHRAVSSTAVPLRFPGHAPLTPTAGHGKERSMSFSSPVVPSNVSTPSPHVSGRKSRQERPHSTEIKPLYLVERNRKTPEVEDALPSLPSSGPSSRASSVHLSDAYESAVEELESPVSERQKLQIDTDGAEQWRKENGDVLGSKETTPKASEAPQQPFFPSTGERQVKQEPQFYTWEDFAREESVREVDENLPPLPRSRSTSPPKPDVHVGRDGMKVAAAAALIGTAAVYAAGELRSRSPERVVDVEKTADRERRDEDLAPAAAPETEIKREAPLVRKSSMKKKGKKAKKLQWEDQAGEAAAAIETPVSESFAPVESDTTAQQPEPAVVFASAAAHTTPAFDYSVASQEPEPTSHPSPSETQLDDGTSAAITRSLDDRTDSQAAMSTSTGQLEQEPERPSTSYKIPTAKSEPAPLVVEERVAAVGMDDAPSVTAEIEPAPQLTRKLSKKSKKKQKSVSLFEDEPAPTVDPTLDQPLAAEPLEAHSDNMQEAQERDALAVDTPAPPVNFGMSDFRNLVQRPAAGWHDSQAEAFQSAMLEQASKPQVDSEIQETRDLDLDQVPTTVVANSCTAQEAGEDEFAAVPTKKQGKKGKKQKAAVWPEPENVPASDLVEPMVTASAEDLSGDAVYEANPAIEEPAQSSSSKKKSKKDKKKSWSAWDQSENQDESTSSMRVPADTSSIADAQEATRAIDHEPTPVLEEPVFSSAPKKKSKKEKKKQFSAWGEPEVQEDLVPLPEKEQPVETQESLPETAQEKAAVDGSAPSPSSKKKSKKDKKSKKSSWDGPELPEESALLQEPQDAAVNDGESQAVEHVPESSQADDKAGPEVESVMPEQVPLPADPEPRGGLDSLPLHSTASEDGIQIAVDATQEEPPIIEESAPMSSSKKKSKKDKKKRLSAWDEPEPPVDQASTPSAEDVKIESQLDADSSLPTADAAVSDDFSPAVSKKGKKGKKNRQSLAWSDSAPEPAPGPPLPDDDDDAAFVDAEEMQAAPDSQPRLEDEQPSTQRDVTGGLIAAAGSAAAVAAVAGLMHSNKDEPEPAKDDFALASSRKSKKQKKQRANLDWTETETDAAQPEPQDEFVDAEESPVVDDPLPLEAQATEVSPVDNSRSAPDAGNGLEAPSTTEIVDMAPASNEPTATLSRKQSKKDKKKNRQSQAWEPEPEQASPALVNEGLADRAGEDFASEQPTQSSADVDLTTPNEEASASALSSKEMEPVPILPRKQSKKDKKKNRQTFSWEPGTDLEVKDEEPAKDTDAAQVPSSGLNVDRVDLPGEAILPVERDAEVPETRALNDDSFTTPAAHEDDLATESVTESKEADLPADIVQTADIQPLANEDDTATSTRDLDSATSDILPDTLEAQDNNGEPETDDFFGPADPSMDEPSRMTEDLDAFGEPNPLSMEKEKRRAAREAAESARIAESMRERPKDENYASMLTARKPIAKKGSKKGRKSISSVTPPTSAALETNETADEPAGNVLPDAEEIDKLGESLPVDEAADAANVPLAIDEAEDEDPWTSSSKKGKKGKKGRKSISETSAALNEAMSPAEDLTAEEQTVIPEDATAVAQDADANAQLVDAPQDEDEWASGSKKKSKKGKNARKSISDASPAIEEPGDDQPLISEAGATTNQEAEFAVQADAPQDEDEWTSSGKKKSKKDKKNRKSVSEVPPPFEDTATGEQTAMTGPQESISKDLEASISPAEDVSRDAGFIDEQPATPVVESDDFGWATGSKKKGKKSKRTSTIAPVEPVVEETDVADTVNLAAGDMPRAAEPDAEHSLPVDESATPVTEPQENDFSWTSGSKKKGKKGKRNQSMAEPSSVPEDTTTRDDADGAFLDELAREVESTAQVDREPAEPMLEDDSAWSSGSKKKGKKGKRNQSMAEEVPASEEPPTHDFVEAQRDAGVTTTDSRQAVEESSRLDTQSGPSQDFEDVPWSSSSKKKNKKSKEDRSSTSEMPVADEAVHQAKQPRFGGFADVADAVIASGAIAAAAGGLQVNEPESTPLDTDEPAAREVSDAHVTETAQNTLNEAPAVEEDDSAWAMPTSKKKSKKGRKSLSGTVTTATESTQAVDQIGAMAAPTSPEEDAAATPDNEPQAAAVEDPSKDPEAENSADVPELPASSSKKKGKKGKKSGPSTPVAGIWSEPPVMADTETTDTRKVGDVALAQDDPLAEQSVESVDPAAGDVDRAVETAQDHVSTPLEQESGSFEQLTSRGEPKESDRSALESKDDLRIDQEPGSAPQDDASWFAPQQGKKKGKKGKKAKDEADFEVLPEINDERAERGFDPSEQANNVEPPATLPSEETVQDDNTDIWALPGKDKKGKKGKKAKQAAIEGRDPKSAEIQDAVPESGFTNEGSSETPFVDPSTDAAADDVWAFSVKGKKAKKGKKDKSAWDVEEHPKEEANPESREFAETPADHHAEPDRAIIEDDSSNFPSAEPQESLEATTEEAWAPAVKTKKGKKGKKAKEAWDVEEPLQETTNAEPSGAFEAPSADKNVPEHTTTSDAAEDAEPESQQHAADDVLFIPTLAEAEQQAPETGGCSELPSYEQFPKDDELAAITDVEVADVELQDHPAPSSQDRGLDEADPSSQVSSTEQVTDADSFVMKPSKKDKKKGKKSRSSTLDPWTETTEPSITPEAAPGPTEDEQSRSLDIAAAAASAVVAGALVADATKTEPPEDEWGSFSTKVSKKDKKKAKKNASSTLSFSPDDEVSEKIDESAEPLPESATALEPEQVPVGSEPVAEDEWASILTKKSKKDKKTARQSGSSTPVVARYGDGAGEAIGVVEATPEALSEDFGEVFESESKTADNARVDSEPVEDEDEWASTSIKKSEKDKKKVKQSGASTPVVAKDVDVPETGLTIADEVPETTVMAEDAPASTDPMEDESVSMSSKKSKKDKKKAKKSGSSTPAVIADDEVVEAVPEATLVSNEVAVEETNSSQQAEATPTAQADEPEADEWASFSTAKQSKKDKKKAKKRGVSTPSAEIDEPIAATQALASYQPAQESVPSAENLTAGQTEESNLAAVDPDADEYNFAEGQAQRMEEHSRDVEQPHVMPATSNPAQDIDFAATLAAGLAGSGFNPDMVINDPVFHRRASPPGTYPEADPQEEFGTTTSKRKKGKKGKVRDVEESPPEASIAAVTDSQTPADDFNDTISQGLKGTGFDPDLLEKALASSTNGSVNDVKDDEPEFSFAVTKRKKGKKSKKGAAGEDDTTVSTETGTYPAAEDQNSIATESIPAENITRSREPEEAPLPIQEPEDPASRLTIGGEGEMDVDEMDKAYKAYKKNKRKQRKLKASISNSESAVDTERSAAASDNEVRDKTGPEGFLHTSEISQHLPVAAGRSLPRPEQSDSSGFGLAAAAAGGAGLAAGMLNDTESNRTSNEPVWSFDALRGDETPQTDNKEHQPIRDSGYEEAQRSERNSREVPAIVRTSSSHESLRNRRSLEPLHISTGSTPDEKTPEKRTDNALHIHSKSPSADTPLLPTSKNRTSYLFQSPPDNLAASAGSSSQPLSYDPPTPSQRSDTSGYFNPRGHSEDRSPNANSHARSFSGGDARSTFSPTSGGGPLSPRTPLRAIAEEHHTGKRSKADSDVGGPEQNKLSRRSETPRDIQGIRSRQHTLSPKIREAMPLGPGRAASNPLSTDDIIKRLSWPAVDEENDTVNIDRSHVSRKAIMPDMRSSSVLSNRSATSGTYGRPAHDLRSFSRNSNASNVSSTPSLRRINLSGDLRAASRRGETGSSVSGSAPPTTIPFEAPPTPPLNDDDDLTPGSASRAADMSDVFQGYGDAAESHVSPTRPPSVRKRQSMHINELESRLDSLVAENRALQEARQSHDSSRYVVHDANMQETLQQRDLDLQAKDAEINQIKAMLQPMQEEIARLTEMNSGLMEANRNLVDDTNGRYATLQAEHAQAHEQWQSTTRNLEAMQQEHGRITSGMKDILEAEIATALADKNAEILRLREQLDIATEQIRALQVQIQSSNSSDYLIQRDEDYFDGSCQKLCQHVQQWVLRFSKLSDNRVCRLSTELNDDKLEARLDNAILDGSDVDKLLGERVRRRDVFMSVVMTMVWEYIFTRYLFGMDREQRQKLKALEKLLSDVGPPRAVAHWRATTLTLLSKRPNFAQQCAMDTEAVAIEIFGVLCRLLPPPSGNEQQLLTSLQRVIGIAVDISIEMRTQRAEYIMLPPLQPEYDTNGDLVRKVHFNASLMNERSGFFSSNEELAAEHAVVKIVLFPLVVKKGDDIGEGEEEIVVCPAQVLVRNDKGKGKKVVRVMSGALEMERSQSRLSAGGSVIMGEGGAF